MKPGELQFPGALDTALTLVEVANDAQTTLTAPLGVGQTTATVASTARFSNSGFLAINNELLTFDGKTPTTLLNLTRGEQGTTPAGHNAGDAVEQLITARDHSVLADAVLQIEQKLGKGASTPPGSAGKELRTDASGNSVWTDRTYVHTQSSAAAVWTITHNLNCFPAVSVVDSAGSTVEGNIEYLTVNQVRLTFSAPFGGTAYLN